ncbi:hypothetical protein LB467_16715 [Salegentibacter sp. JZCK2]|uniref:hypothetical protein n=1 Tax=Salegentibacter tibetensis TaxID=2873600 RepID=UPI001CC9B640|nr:hypothetical protein [Salegentibacter tibetensis]MBZ9731334.1 hypothetical protein [Salegentibacter tibetensis]
MKRVLLIMFYVLFINNTFSQIYPENKKDSVIKVTPGKFPVQPGQFVGVAPKNHQKGKRSLLKTPMGHQPVKPTVENGSFIGVGINPLPKTVFLERIKKGQNLLRRQKTQEIFDDTITPRREVKVFQGSFVGVKPKEN